MSNTEKVEQLHFGTVDSTNAWAKRYAAKLPRDRLLVIIADQQTAGYGRQGAPWCSPAGVNLYATFFFVIPPSSAVSHLAQLLALSARRALSDLGVHTTLKWPNDLMVDRQKLAGTLAETVMLDGQLGIAAGIGINVNITAAELADVGQPATSMREVLSQEVNREQLLAGLIRHFQADLSRFNEEAFIPFEAELQEALSQFE